MKDRSKFEDMVRKDLDVRASDRTYDRLREAVLNARGRSRTAESAATRIIKCRTIVKDPVARLAAAAVIALAVLLPAGYAAVEAVVRYFTISEDRVAFEIQEPNHAVGFAARRGISVGGTNIATEAEARAGLEEFYRLHRAGKAQEIQPGLWQVTLANGELFKYKGNPEWVTSDSPAELKTEFEEINALRRAAQGERTLLGEAEHNGRTLRMYKVRYTLSSGKVVTVLEMASPDGSLAGMGGSGGGGIGGGGFPGTSVP
jgi:hypothetical protein